MPCQDGGWRLGLGRQLAHHGMTCTGGVQGGVQRNGVNTFEHALVHLLVQGASPGTNAFHAWNFDARFDVQAVYGEEGGAWSSYGRVQGCMHVQQRVGPCARVAQVHHHTSRTQEFGLVRDSRGARLSSH